MAHAVDRSLNGQHLRNPLMVSLYVKNSKIGRRLIKQRFVVLMENRPSSRSTQEIQLEGLCLIS